MATLEELQQRAKKRYEEEQKKREQGTTQSTSGTASIEELQQRAKKRAIEEDAKKVDATYINNFLNSYSSFFGSAEEDYKKVGWGNASAAYDSRRTTAKGMDYNRQVIQKWYDSNADRLDSQTRDVLSGILGSYDNDMTSVLNSFYGARDFYAQWDTEEKYNFWDDHRTVENRQQWYSEQESRLEQLKAEREAENSKWGEVDPIMLGVESMEYQTAAHEHTQKLKAIDDEIAAIETEMLNYKRGNYNEDGQYYGSKVVDDYHGYTERDDFEVDSANRDYKNPTIEDLKMLDAYNDYSAWHYDVNGVYRDAFGNELAKDEETNTWYNPMAQQYQVEDKLGMFLSAGEEGVKEAYKHGSTYADLMQEGELGGWQYLEESEIAIYYYLLNESQESAYKYLSDMQTELNRRETMQANQSYVKNYNEAGLLEKIALNAATVPAQLVGGVAGTLENVSNALMGKEINPYSVAHSGSQFSSTIRSETAKDINSDGGDIPILTDLTGFTLGDAYQAGMSILDSYAAIGIGGGLGGALLASSAANSEATRLYEQGASMKQIALGSAAAGAAEMVFESLSIDKLINMKDATTVGQAIKNALIQGGIEASEEGFTEIANILTNSIIMGNQSDWAKLVEANGGGLEGAQQAFMERVRDVVNASIGGFISGAGSAGAPSVASAGANAIGQEVRYSNAGKAIMNADGGVDALKALAMDVAGANESSKLAKQSSKITSEAATGKGVGKLVAAVKNKSNQRAVGRVYEAVRAEVTAQNQADIAKSLESTGFSAKSAKNIANAIVAQANGKELGEFEKSILESVKGNKKVEEIVSNVLNDAESTDSRRNFNLAAYNMGINFGVGISPDAARTNPAQAGEEIASTEGNLSADVKTVSEGSYEVSVDGKTLLDGQEVKLNGFRQTEDGSVMVATADNQTADPGEVTYSSKGQAIIYENYASIESTTSNPVIANMPVSDRSELAMSYDPASGVDAKAQFLGLNQSYWYGFEGIAMDEKSMPENSLVRNISEEQRASAYELGRKAAEKATKTQAAGIQAAYEKAVEKLGGKEKAQAAAKKNEGKVIIQRGFSKIGMTKQQKSSIKMAEIVAKAVGTDIYVYHGMKEYGKYDQKTGKIWLNMNAMFSGQSMMAFTLAHELVHMAKQGSPAEFKEFADYLLEQYGKKGVSAEYLIREQMENAKRNGYTLDEHEAYEEVIADACQRMLLDSDALQKMAAFKEKNPTLWQKIVDAIKEFIAKVRKAFDGAEPDSTEAALYKEFDDAVKEHLEKKFVDMVMDAGEHLSTIRNAFGKGTVVEVNENGEFTLAKGKDAKGVTKFLYNDYTWEKGGRDTLAAALKAEGFSKEDIDAALTIMDGKHKLVKDLAKQFPEQDRINQATITTDLKDGHSVLSALVSNGDYPVNIDLLMVCKKRKAYQRVINRLCETGLIQQATVDALAIAEINKILGKYGFETACLGCFVESRRLRIQEWANTIVKEWNAEVKKRDPNAKAFGFGKGEATLTQDEVMQLVGELESGGEKNDQGNLNLGQGSAVKRMGVLLDKVPSLRRTLSIEDLITPDGLSSLRRFDSNLFSMVKSRYGSNSPKFVQEFNPYNHELAMYGKVPSEYKSLREYLYAIGGARMQSFSDFIVENWFDYCQIVADLAARKLPMHTYTKEIALAKLFGLTGIKINMSLIPDIDRSLGKEYAGLTRNANGELELIWADKDRYKATGGKSYMQSVNFADAIALQNDPRYSANVGTIAVGVSDQHILMMLDDNRIRMVIPYHSSGMNPIFADLMGTSFYKDYTMFQNTTVKQIYNSKGQPVSLKLDKTQTGKLTSGFQFNEVLQELGDARAAAQAYKDWCADASKHTITIKGETYTAELTPKFDDFSGHENYYKLLEDFNTYDCISEQAAQQGDVQQIYPEDFDNILKGELTAQETHRQKQEANQSFDKAMGEIESYLNEHTKADTVFYAEQHGINLSAKDKKLSIDDKKKLADLRNGAKMSMPKTPAPTFYSQMAKVVDSMKQDKFGASSVVSMLRGRGVKAEEIKWSGIETFLEGKKSVTKAELQEFIAGSMLQIEEEILDNKDRPYTEDQQKRLDEYEAKRDEVAKRLAAEWKKITGEEFPIRNPGAGLESSVVNKIIDANKEYKDAAFEGRLLKKLRKDLQEVIKNNDDFGFDSWKDALRAIHRHRKDFIKNYEMSTNDKAIIVKYCNALNAYNELPNKITDEDADRLRAIAREADPWTRKIMEVKHEHNEEEAKHMTNWGEYSLEGGKNYREMLFRVPSSTYSNAAMFGHWKDRSGVLAHARVQDMDTSIGKMLFVEEIQSDWHNEGHKEGYRKEGEKTDLMLSRESKKAYEEFYAAVEKMLERNANWEDDNAIYYAHPVVVAEMFDGNESYFEEYGFTEEQIETIRSMVAEEAARQEALKTAPKHDMAPDAPFKDTYHEYVLKRLLRMAAEEGYDSIGWTPAAAQMDRWNPDRKTNAQMGITDAKNPDAVAFEEAYRNVYDRRMKKFLSDFGEKWGTSVGNTVLDNGTEVWSMAITDSMTESVLYEGQPKYSMPKKRTFTYKELVARGNITGDVIKSSDYVRMKNGKIDEAWVIDRVKSNCKQVQTKSNKPTYYAEAPDIGRNVQIINEGITHGFGEYKNDKKGKPTPAALINARVTLNLVNILRTAIEVNQSKRGSNIDVPFTHIMLGVTGMENADGTIDYYAVRIEIEERVNRDAILVGANVLGRLYAVNAKKISSPHAQVIVDDDVALATGSFEYSVADLLKDVKHEINNTFSVDVYQKLKMTRNKDKFSANLLYKTPNSSGMTTRQLLADAFDELVQTPKERELMDEYRNNISMVEDVQERLRKLRSEISKQTKAKGDKGKIAEMNKTAKELAELIDKYDRKLLELEASKPLRDVLARARSAAYQEARQRSEESMKEYRQQVSERFDRGVEGRRKTEKRKKIRKVIRELDKILNRGDKKKNVKEDMKDFVAEALASAEVLFTDNYTNEDIIRNGFGVELSKEEAKYLEEARAILVEMSNLPTGGYDAWQARQEAEEQLKSKLAYRMSKLKDAFFRERQMLNKTEVAEVLGKLADAYAKLETSEYSYVNGAYHEAVYEYLKMLQEDVGGAKVKDMTLGQLGELYKAYTMVLTTVQNANKMFAEGLKMSKEQLANRVMMEVYQAGGEHGLWTKGQLSRNQASWNNTKPIYAAERTGSPTFVKLVNGLFNGQYGWATDMEEAKAFRQKVADKYGFKNWDMEKLYKFTSSSGIEFELNLNQIMSLYAYAKREQAHDHLLKGGFVFGKNTEVVVTKNGVKRTYLNKSAKAHNISDEIMGEIVSKLSKEQKGFVDEMQDYLSTTMGGKGNEVSMRIYGVKLFMEKFYFPLRSAGQFKEKAKEAELKQQQGQISIVNSGFTKAVTPKASNPVVLDGFTDVWAGHVNEMSLYHSMVLPMEDFRRVYNYASPHMEGQESASVNSFIENAYGDAATGYFDQLYKELNGGAIVDPRENLSKQMIGKFKKSAVMFSNSVWVQQFSAIGRAYALIDPKHFIGAKIDKKRHAELWEEMKKYAPVTIIKEMGGFDTHTGASASDYLLAEEYGKGERFKGFINDDQYRDKIMGLLPAKADELTWCAIWEAVKRETKAMNPKMDAKSDEFLKKAGERFSEVIEKTQVYDSVLARSANMRSKQGLMQMLTAFMAEPTTTVNMIEDALRKGNKKVIARTFGAVAASIILNNALASIIYAMRDDDEDETWWEKYAQAFTSGMLDDINPMTYYPILKDIWSLFQGYDIERSDMAIYSDIADAVKKAVTVVSKYDSEMDDEDAAKYYKQVTDAVMGLLDAGAAAFGVPLKNARRDLKSYYNTYVTLREDLFGDRDTTWNSFLSAVGGSALDAIPVVGLVAGRSDRDKLYDAIVSGDTTYANRLKSGYKDQNAINSAIRKALRENDPRIHEAAIAWNANDLNEYMRIAKEIIAEKHFLQDDVVMAIRSEAEKLSPDAETATVSKAKGLFTAEKFAEAIAKGDQAVANAIKVDIIQTAEKNGKTQEEAEKSFASSAKSELKELFLAGAVSENAVINALTTYCDIEQEDALADVQYWAFKQDYPDVYADDSWFDKYYEDVADSGLGIDLYMDYRNQVRDIEGEGKKERRMAVIHSLPITSAQKDALYYAEGWAASKLYEAPWH